ncbi:hypothetical protein [Niveibacterium microcysteis]|uniref:Uncharacterized protein n=1 Tax=Niveibacterium microcysteis TaxID=2811415 RepID=A0ABX7M7F2_9RHOO|nr:hypothetical protein [Niveibacterium microcysteis]QSI76831.1 hypothetical protein JY500_20675 [Niveibacterium microcysteis]
MKTVLWSITAVLGLLWSGAVALAHSVAAWAATAAGTADAQTLAAILRDWPLPAWLAWADPAMLESLRMALSAVGTGLVLSQPWIATAIGWIGPALWLVWALGIALLLALASIAHLLIHRLAPRPSLVHAAAGGANR